MLLYKYWKTNLNKYHADDDDVVADADDTLKYIRYF